VALYVGLVVFPVVLSITTAAYLQGVELQLLSFEHDGRMARTGLALLQQEMQTSTRLLSESNMDVIPSDSVHPGVAAALAGDTVLALERGELGLDAALYLMDADGAVRSARRSASEPVLRTLEARAGYEAVFYLRGVRAAATDPNLGPETLSAGLMAQLQVLDGGVAVGLPGGRGALVPLRTAPGSTSGNVAMLAMPTSPRPASLTGVFALLAGAVAVGLIFLRIGTLGGYRKPVTGTQRLSTEFLVTSVPLVLAMIALVLVVIRFRADLASEGATLLTRELAVATSLGPGTPVSQIQRVTTFDATRLAGSSTYPASSTLPPGPALSRISSGLVTPGHRVVSGRIPVAGNDVVYAAVEEDDGSILVLSEPEHMDELRGFTARMGALGILLLLLLMLYPQASSRALRQSRL